MQSKIRLGLAIIASLLFSTCDNNDNPAPEPGKISFKWTRQDPAINDFYYAVVSDTTGKIIDWKELPDGELVELIYVPVGETGTVSIILKVGGDDDDSYSTEITTFTDVSGGDYVYTENRTYNEVGPGRHDIIIEGFNDYDNFGILTRSGLITAEFSEDYKLTASISADHKEDLFVSLQVDQPDQFRYLYKDEITNSTSTIISRDDFEELPLVPGKAISYPELKDMKFGSGIYIGYHEENNAIISINQWASDSDPEIGFVDIPDLFTSYESVVFGFTEDDAAVHIIDIKSAQPETQFDGLNADLISSDLKTSRISADLSGEGPMVFASNHFTGPIGYTSWTFFAPKTDHIRKNLPLFTDDILAEIPGLALARDKQFGLFGIADYNMTYEQFYKFRFADFYHEPDISRVKQYFSLDGSSGRMSLNPMAALKRQKRLFENSTLKKH
jgi:hypothetical protein